MYCIQNIFTVQDFWATGACLQKQGFPAKFLLYWIYFLPFKIFEQLCAYPEKQSLPWNFSLYSIYCLHSGFLSSLHLSWIRCIEYIFFTVTCGKVRDLGGTVSFKAKSGSVWIEWSRINSTLNWLLAEWLLLMLSIPYHHFLHTYTVGTMAILDLKKVTCRRTIWSNLWPACLTALLKSWNSLTAYAYVQNACSGPIENADHQYDRQLQRVLMKYAK